MKTNITNAQVMKKRKIIIGAVLVIALAVWVQSRWHAWFHNPEELPYTPSAVPCRVLLTFGDIDERSRNISWQCGSEVRPSLLQLVNTADSDTVQVVATGEVFASRSGRAAYYMARLRQLKPDSHYAYRAVTDGKASKWYEFQTPREDSNSLSFLYVGDVQDSIGGQANRYLREAVGRHPQTELLVCGGDLTERPTEQCWAETFRDIDSVSQAMPLLCVTGNHDYLKGIITRLERRFPLVFSYFLDSQVGDNQVFTVRQGPAQFFLLDSNREFFYLKSQRDWLREALKTSTARWKIVVLHHPLFSIKGSSNNLIQRWMFNDLIEEYGVDLVLQGHEHAYARMTRHDADGAAVTPVYTVSHCSPKCYRITFDDRFDKYGISSRYYQTVDISGDTLAMATYEVYRHTLYDSLQVIKTAKSQVVVKDYGTTIPEHMQYTPDPDSKKDRAFAERIADYVRKHPERMKR